jgi:hypothetical protein
MEEAAWRQQAVALERMGRHDDAQRCLATAERRTAHDSPSQN